MKTSTDSTFLDSSHFIQSRYTLQEIHRRWNASGKGRACKLATVKRWLSRGPRTKNPRFEPFVIDWAKKEVGTDKDISYEDAVQIVVGELKDAVANDRFRSVKAKAYAAGLVAFYEVYPHFTDAQFQLMTNLYNQL